MGIFRDMHVLLTLFKWCALVPYVPYRMETQLKIVYRRYVFQIALTLFAILVVTYLRGYVLTDYASFLNNLSYIMWLLAATVDTLVICLMLVTNGLNVVYYETLIVMLERIERAIDEWKAGQQRRFSDPPYRWFSWLFLLLALLYHLFAFYRNLLINMHLMLQIRWELMLTDLYLCHVFLLLHAMGQCARHLRRMCRDAIDRNNVSELCAVLRLRDDLLHCVALVNRIHGVLFLGVSTSWLVSVTCIVYFDFIYSGLQFNPNHPYILEHTVMFIWKSALVGGLLAVAGAVVEKIKQITQFTQQCGIVSLCNRPLAKMIDKLLIKCQFQDIRFTVYELFTIDNSLNYMVISSIVIFLVIVTQFRQMEIENENKMVQTSEPFMSEESVSTLKNVHDKN